MSAHASSAPVGATWTTSRAPCPATPSSPPPSASCSSSLSLLVFMAFTLVLIPVSLLGLIAGIAVTAFGIIGWGHRLGRHLPRAATAGGAAVVLVSLQLLGAVPIVGDIVVGFVLLSGLGAVAITYLGFTEFHPAPLPALTSPSRGRRRSTAQVDVSPARAPAQHGSTAGAC